MSALSASTPFLPGSTVKVYRADGFPAWEMMAEGEPPGRPAATATVSKDGTVAFPKLKKGERFFAAQEIDGKWRYVAFTAK